MTRHILIIALVLCAMGAAPSMARADGAALFAQAEQAWAANDYIRARQHYEAAAEEGNVKAMLVLGYITGRGLQFPRDPVASAEWYRRAADAGSADGKHQLALLYHDGPAIEGNPLPRDRVRALRLFEEAFAGGWPWAGSAAGYLHDHYDPSDDIPTDYAKAAHYYTGAAFAGVGAAQSNLGVLYESGRGVPQDLRAARLWFLLAGQQGIEAALGALDRMGPSRELPISAEATRLIQLSTSVLAEDDYDAAKRKSFEYTRQAAALGHPGAINAMVYVFKDGRHGIAKDLEQARRWALAGAELGDRVSQKLLGQFLVDGIGGPADVLGARFWYEKAALAGDRQAMSLLAELYDGKFGFPPNPALSTHWYLQAYRAGDVRVQGILEDRGVLKPSPEAAAFIARIESAGPDASSPGAFMTDVAIYCKYGGSRCDQLSREALAMQRSHNANVRSADLQRIWSAGPSANQPASQGQDRAACLRKQTEALQRYTYGEQDWYFVGQC